MIAEHLPQLALAWSIQLVGVVAPGPSVMLILGVAMSQGRAPSIITAFGVACGTIVLSTATVIGLAALFAQMAELVTAVRLIGAAYLLWLAYGAFRTAALPSRFEVHEGPQTSAWRVGLRGFILQVSNPKAIVFWLAIAAAGGVGNAPLPIAVLFVAGAFVNSFIGHGGYALILSSTPMRALYQRFRGWIESALGCFFVFASYKLITTRQ